MYAVIMAAGTGTRLWPLSRKNKPKQLHSLVGEKSLLRQTFERILPLIEAEKILVIASPDYLDDIKKELPEIKDENYVIQPFVMNTAACCGLATKILNDRDPSSSVIFLPSDHSIQNPKRFLEILKFAEEQIEKYPEKIIQVGINPTRPDTGMGYIQLGNQIFHRDDLNVFEVKRFVEKPDVKTAQEYLSSWEFLWNSGMYLWQTSFALALFEKFLPQTFEAILKIVSARGTKKEEEVLNEYYAKVDNTSIDYGVIEKIKDVVVIPGDFGWSDVGSWWTLLETLQEIGNTRLVVNGKHLDLDSVNSLIYSQEKLVATVGLKDIVIVDTPDVLLVCDRHQSAKVKDLIEKLKADGQEKYL